MKDNQQLLCFPGLTGVYPAIDRLYCVRQGLLCTELLKLEIYIVVNLQGSARTSEAYDIKKSEGNALFSVAVCCWCFVV